ncbi:MAG: hypothetical protein QXU32_07355 [Nitrososphaerales archaeon]
MVKATNNIRKKAVLLYTEGLRQASDIGSVYGISDRTKAMEEAMRI